MKILLDECVPKKFRHELKGHRVFTVPQMGWASKKNGELLRLMTDEGFEAFITVDQNISYQQNPAALTVPVIVIVAENNKNEALKPLAPQVLEKLETLKPGQLIEVALDEN
ncbi:MAG: hypothetical protein SF123_06350 [Chloroflexota bacterium]|nr:hypothetical protein [Chloroflexota bacterium]